MIEMLGDAGVHATTIYIDWISGDLRIIFADCTNEGKIASNTNPTHKTDAKLNGFTSWDHSLAIRAT